MIRSDVPIVVICNSLVKPSAMTPISKNPEGQNAAIQDSVTPLVGEAATHSVEASAGTSACKVDSPPTRREKLAAAAMSGAALLVFYVLSAGPMAGLHRVIMIKGFQRTVEVIYAPLALLAKAGPPPIAAVLRWYVDLFRG